MDYAKLIKFIREKKLLTQMELADILHVSFTTISRWESGKFEPTMKIKRKIIEYCAKNNINVEDVK
ncbi:MAG: helix-turn-helix transcriptional regulator [Acholeplasmataceae bacterium]